MPERAVKRARTGSSGPSFFLPPTPPPTPGPSPVLSSVARSSHSTHMSFVTTASGSISNCLSDDIPSEHTSSHADPLAPSRLGLSLFPSCTSAYTPDISVAWASPLTAIAFISTRSSRAVSSKFLDDISSKTSSSLAAKIAGQTHTSGVMSSFDTHSRFSTSISASALTAGSSLGSISTSPVPSSLKLPSSTGG